MIALFIAFIAFIALCGIGGAISGKREGKRLASYRAEAWKTEVRNARDKHTPNT